MSLRAWLDTQLAEADQAAGREHKSLTELAQNLAEQQQELEQTRERVGRIPGYSPQTC